MTSDPVPPDQPLADTGTLSTRASRRSRTMVVSRKVGVLLVGIPVLALGIALLPLPGPGSLVILAGLAILSLEFAWADRWAKRIRAEAKALFDRITGRG